MTPTITCPRCHTRAASPDRSALDRWWVDHLWLHKQGVRA